MQICISILVRLSWAVDILGGLVDGGVLGASVVLVDLLVDPRGGTGATLNLVVLNTDLLYAAASLWT